MTDTYNDTNKAEKDRLLIKSLERYLEHLEEELHRQEKLLDEARRSLEGAAKHLTKMKQIFEKTQCEVDFVQKTIDDLSNQVPNPVRNTSVVDSTHRSLGYE